MRTSRYILASLRHYRFAYLGVFAGAVLGAAVLLGALFAGDSVEASLRSIAAKRLGHATHLLAGGDRFFRAALADDFAKAARVSAAPVLYARGSVTQPNSRAAIGQVQLVGVTNAFWSFAPEPTSVTLDASKSTVAINDTLARRLNVSAGGILIVRFQKPGVIAGNAPIAGAQNTLEAFRCTVAAVVGDAAFGRFSLDHTQVATPSVFLPIQLLQSNLDRAGRANLLLVDGTNASTDLPPALTRSLQLADYGLDLHWLDAASTFEVSSDRIFLDPGIVEALVKRIPDAQPVAAYLVNEFRTGGRATPYSIAAAATPASAPFLPPDLGPRELAINTWLAEDLEAKVGDDVALKYYQVGAGGELVEHHTNFRVRSIIPLEGLAADKAWMPRFPGITDAAHQSDWDSGLPLDLTRIRPKDERYWETYRGTPKAFLSIAAGRELWSTRWGNLTALRIPFARDREAELRTALLGALKPEMNQLLLRPLRDGPAGATEASVDFGGLFIGMSFFLIVAALGLVAMLFQLALLQRNREDALLGAVGLPPGKLLRWRLAEGAVILLLGCAAGVPLAALYTRGILRFLETIWAGQGAGPTFVLATPPATIAMGIGIFLACSLPAIGFAIRKQTKRSLSIRLAAQTEDSTPPAKVRRRSTIIAIVGILIAVGALASTGRGLPAQISFYLAGFSLLIAGIAVCRRWLAREHPDSRGANFSASTLGVLNLQARRARSLTVVGLIATAVFMVLSVASFRKHVGADWLEPASGTGGFALWVETTAAQSPARDGKSQGFEIFDRFAADLGEIVPVRAGQGDNANCFNLNATAQPRLLAVNTQRFAGRRAFSLKTEAANTPEAAWTSLQKLTSSGAIPVVIDATTLQWVLKRKVGDVLAYADENGRPFQVQIVGTLPDSIFQGQLVVDERLFLERFPSHPGYTIFLLDPKNAAGAAALPARLASALADLGVRVELTRDVLASFHEVENTYIAIFNVLGSLGIILGSLGLVIVVARNLRERRGEFFVMHAIGLPRRVLARMVFAEFSRLVLWGIVIGVVTSALAVWPSLTVLPAAPTITLVAALLAGVMMLNFAAGWAVFNWSLREPTPAAL